MFALQSRLFNIFQSFFKKSTKIFAQFKTCAYLCIINNKQIKNNMATINAALQTITAGKAICTNVLVQMDRFYNVTSAVWQLVGFNKNGELVGYNYQLKKEDLNSSYEAETLRVKNPTQQPQTFVAKIKWVAGETPAECVAKGLNALQNLSQTFVAKTATTVYTLEGMAAVADVTYVFHNGHFYVTSIY